ncbi:MAG: bifunctional 2-C-methyl-D-erythritol 4-phosphate cytidylyltransferase/2-C-methyl-D-erythritol 2,4-cyclodiphosphate synthase [Ferrovibrionaceae bacterium]
MSVVVLIVAAGRGQRAGAGLPKQYRRLAGRPVLARTLAAFLGQPRVDRVAVVIHPDDRPLYDEATAGLDLLPAIAGGPTRQDSVRLGLEALADLAPDIVLVHDAARPFVSPELIGRVIDAVPAIAALPVVDTLKRAEDGKATTGPARDGLWRAQTPQGFAYQALREAHRAAHGGPELTDDAAVAATAGIAAALVEGDEANFKLTTPDDFRRAEALLINRHPDVRVGQGFDVHALADLPGRPLMLGGIAVPHARALAGHSDADVALHALTDAVLGALAEGDIGQAFPPSDERWRGAASDQFLAFARDRVAARGGVIAHVDLTLICERPRIGPHREAMRTRIADILGVDLDRVAVKATTTEKLGFTGRGEGIAAQAVATVRLP